ncbi:hypothetical protein DMN91_006796 [Ooceraea biroi]|uniref:Uncharacterized protein n=1 Tax=Ooceraea biroi TaxID=2015173 RepID=A0A3L8DJW0_OOCBI|nr:hypothetical protein DMN91_006796 [Ooceraea biroi]
MVTVETERADRGSLDGASASSAGQRRGHHRPAGREPPKDEGVEGDGEKPSTMMGGRVARPGAGPRPLVAPIAAFVACVLLCGTLGDAIRIIAARITRGEAKKGRTRAYVRLSTLAEVFERGISLADTPNAYNVCRQERGILMQVTVIRGIAMQRKVFSTFVNLSPNELRVCTKTACLRTIVS